MNTIIAGSDFSQSSVNACKYAALLAQKLNCKLTLFNQFLAPFVHSNAGLYGISYKSEKKASEKKMEEQIHELSSMFPGLKINSFVTNGSFKDELELFTKKHKVQFAVMGLETKTRISKFIYGSHGVSLTGKIEVPVIVVPEKYKVHRLENVLLAVDNQEKIDHASLKPIERFVKTTGSKVDVLHVRTPEELILYYNKNITLNGKKVEVPIHKAKSIEDGIRNYCKQKRTDLVVLMSRKHSALYNFFNESVTKKVIFVSRTPVMSVHT